MIATATRTVFAPVYCTGTLPNGNPCPVLLFVGDLQEVSDAEQAVMQQKCRSCKKLTYFGIVTKNT